ncbi:MAG: 2-oxo acid dehydrogenase subunit E2 [Acidimicrobiia bacterium]|nr:2-oxo acid dehydrogenase subunit E2 [Acidimicrobiia bacterium]
MAVSVVMPALEMAQETGKLVSWLKKEGEHVRKGEMLLEIETDKAVVEVEALSDGILGGVTAKEGDVVPVGQTIAWLLKEGEQPPAAPSTPAQTGRRTDAAPAAAVAAPAAAAGTGRGARVSPKARKMAQEHGVDLSKVTGSGPGGEILADDILNAAQTFRPAPATPPATHAPISSIARLMAERTTQSWTTAPHFFLTRDVDATALNVARETLVPHVERSHGVKVTHTDLLVAAVARALRRQPRLNGSWANGTITLNEDINIALAMAFESGTLDAVVTAVIPKADTLSVGDIAKRRMELAERAEAGRLQPSDISGGTFTISNLGMFKVDAFTAIIVPPQAAILAVGAIVDRVVAVNGQPAVRPMMKLTLSTDHRVADGLRSAIFMHALVEALEYPDFS